MAKHRLKCMSCSSRKFTVYRNVFDDGSPITYEYRCDICSERMDLEWIVIEE